MIEFLEEIDQQIVLAINSWNSPFLDEVMWVVSARITWIPLYLILLYLAYKKLGAKQLVLFIAFVLISVAVADLVSVHLFKNVFLRYRPSHNLLLTDKLHYYLMKPNEFYKGGEYGFISSHASNYFAIATGAWLILKDRYPKLIYLLLGIGVIICYSRIYLGVHYLSDVLVGALVGSLISYGLLHLFYKPLAKKIRT